MTPQVIEELERRWGKPRTVQLAFEMQPHEWQLMLRSRSRRRVHDVTIFVMHHGKLAVIRKPSYPPGAWRAPSGGVEREETFEDGLQREAYEETGLCVEPYLYLLRTSVTFSHTDDSMVWTSHVFQAKYVSGEPHPVDTREIADARWASLAELAGESREAMLAAGSGGFEYRAKLHDLVVPLLDNR